MAAFQGLCRSFRGLSLQYPQSRSTASRSVGYMCCLNGKAAKTRHFSLGRPILASIRSLSSKKESEPTPTQPHVFRADDGRQFAAFDTTIYPKLKPYIVRRRMNRMKTYEGAEKNIRHSPWRLNLVCQLAAGMPLQEALTQLEFCRKSRAPLVQKVLQRTANLADIRDGLQPSQLEVAECFATKGTPLKRIKIMGRGRSGRMERRHSHMRVVLRQIDFRLRIYQAPSVNQKKKWFLLQQQAERDAARAQAEREERERLEREAEAAAAARKKENA